MQLVNEFTVPASPDLAFETLSDLERMVNCLPGAVLDGRDGDEYQGRLTVRIGPVGLSLSATGTVLDRDEQARRFVVRGSARERSGQGTAQALITMTVADASHPDRSTVAASTVRVVTELDLSGRVAQFGGAAITQVNRRIVGQFVTRLDAMIRAEQQPELAAGAAATPSATTADGTPQRYVVGSNPWSRHDIGPVAAALAGGILLGAVISRAMRSAGAGQHCLQLDGRAAGK